ncbi:MAG: GNAT family N-acetyltransferase [Bacteroidota bacterium]|nr:GNAT family N-acetyltransferase [Bacteroidota bacterium]
MQLVEVNNKKTHREFLDVPRIIYKNDPVWVCPLDGELEATFDRGKNTFYQHGDAVRWVLKDDSGHLIGRVAAFINWNKARTYQQPTGGMGFFECINDKTAAFMLFDACQKWLTIRGMEAMDGPINFGENDVNWGLLVDGFTHPGVGMNYNPPYYREFFESYGFKFYFEQISNHLDLRKPFPDRFWKIAKWVLAKQEFRFVHFSWDKQDEFIHAMKEVYDNAWEFHENFTPLEVDVILKTVEKAKIFIDEEMLWFVFHKDEPVAFLIMFPDINQVLHHLNGKINLMSVLRFYYLLKIKNVITRARIVIMGVKPKYQRFGLESGIFWHLNEAMKHKPKITELELSWVGDFNPKMRALHESVGAVFAKRHITYRKIFSSDIEFQRSSIIPVDTKEKALKTE